MSGIEELLAGRTLVRRYRIEEVIGRGGMAAVYRATDERLGRPVAVKVITLAAPDAEARETHRERFEREARAAASLPQHPNVVTVHDFGVDPELGLDFLVMEFLHGRDLATYLREQGRPPLDLALYILREAAEGLAVGHRARLVHRDVKPGNIFLAEPHGDGAARVCVLDFGIARVMTEDPTATRLTHEGTPLSPAYASPEQHRGVRDLTPASDVFSLGVVAYQLLTGERPFPPERSVDPASWTPRRPVRQLAPEVSPEVEAVVLRALSFAPESRFPDAVAFCEALGGALADTTAVGAPWGMAAAGVPAAVAGVDEEHTLLQPQAAAPPPPPLPPPATAPAPRRAEAPKRASGAIWAVLALAAVAAVAGVWALSGGGGSGPGSDPGTGQLPVVVEEEAPSGVDASPSSGVPAEGGGAGSAGGAGGPVTGGSAQQTPVPIGQSGSVGSVGTGTPQPAPASEGQGAASSEGAAPAQAGPPPQTTPEAQPRPAPQDSVRPPPKLLGVPVNPPESRAPPSDTGGGASSAAGAPASGDTEQPAEDPAG